MSNRRQLSSFFKKIQVVRSPKRRLATFGSSRIDYQVVTDVTGMADRSRVRSGVVIADRPQIITPQALRDQFSGFGPDSAKFADTLAAQYGDALRGLEYQFSNEMVGTRIELSPPDRLVDDLARREDHETDFNTAVITGTDRFWELSVMKFIVEETMASFASNVKDLQQHGFFDTDDVKGARRHAEVRSLIRRAKLDRGLVPTLGAMLKRHNLFEQYQDEFFRLVNR